MALGTMRRVAVSAPAASLIVVVKLLTVWIHLFAEIVIEEESVATF